jgi:eukaryotic-like serine/threonine-protein kinase
MSSLGEGERAARYVDARPKSTVPHAGPLRGASARVTAEDAQGRGWPAAGPFRVYPYGRAGRRPGGTGNLLTGGPVDYHRSSRRRGASAGLRPDVSGAADITFFGASMSIGKRVAGLLHGGPGVGWVGGYLVVSWGVLQFTDTMGSLLGLPLWFGKAVLGLLGVGLVAVAVTALLHGGEAALEEVSAARNRWRRNVTWRRTGLVGLAAFAVLGAGTAGHLGARALGVGPVGTMMARGILPEDVELVLAELEDHTGEPGVARAATEALRVHLSQSPTIRLAPSARVRAALERMAAPPDAALDLATAREVAVREGLVAVVGGEIHRVGNGYTVSARLVAAETGEDLVAALETAREPDDVVEAVERVSLRLRERIGESLRSVRRSPPLGRVRTSSLAALKSYTEAVDANLQGEFERCILLMDEAIALDSTFAMAYEGRAACNQNLGRNPAQQVADRILAYEMRDRMTEEERLRATAIYHQFVTQDRRQAIEAWEAYAARYPDRAAPLFNLANLYAETRELARAEATALRGLELSPSSLVVLINLAFYQANQGRFADALATLARFEAEAPGANLAWRKATVHLAAADWEAARLELAEARERARGSASQRALVATLQSGLALTLGRVGEAERLLREAMEADLEGGDRERYHLRAIALAELYLSARRDTAGARAVMDQALTTHPLEALDPLDRSYLGLARLFAAVGAVDRARSYIARFEEEVEPLLPAATVSHRVRAVLAEAEGRLEDAVAEWRLEDEEREDPLPALAHMGALFDRMEEADSAIAYYQRYLTTPSRLRYNSDPDWRGHVLERLGRLHEARGEAREAARYYAMLVELWADADPILAPRVDYARDRMRRLLSER